MKNLELWDALEKTDPYYTKEFKASGFSGTSINSTWNLKRITELLGPCGKDWGFHIVNERIAEARIGDELAMTHICHMRMWFRHSDEITYNEAVGTTLYAHITRKGDFRCDHEAPKKSVTDAMSKLMLMLGASADVWLGYYDDNGYVREMKREFDAMESEKARDAGGDVSDRDSGADRGRDRGVRDRSESVSPRERDPDTGGVRPGDSDPPGRPRTLTFADPSGRRPDHVVPFERAAELIESFCARATTSAHAIETFINRNMDEIKKVPGLLLVMENYISQKEDEKSSLL